MKLAAFRTFFLIVASLTASQALRIKRPSLRTVRYTTALCSKDSSEDNSNALQKISAFFNGMGNFSIPHSSLPSLSLPSVLTGAVLGAVSFASILFIPILTEEHTQMMPPEAAAFMKSIEKPVVLFEDILADLQANYVDDVNAEKLFETAMASMLKSLDPYTEFENIKTARSMQESVSGRYGGVGMVIASSKPKLPNLPSTSTTYAGKAGKETETPSPSAASSSSSSSFGGVTVMDAFEGYAYNGGIRVGDRLLAVGGVDTSRMGVEQVRDLLRGEPDTDVVIRFERDEYGQGNKPSVKEV